MLPFLKIPLRIIDDNSTVAESLTQPADFQSLIPVADGTIIVFKNGGNILTTPLQISELEKHVAGYWKQINQTVAKANEKTNFILP